MVNDALQYELNHLLLCEGPQWLSFDLLSKVIYCYYKLFSISCCMWDISDQIYSPLVKYNCRVD